jgi:serine-type D-Ala-D-Ala carboxypeptidase/endopeptidase
MKLWGVLLAALALAGPAAVGAQPAAAPSSVQSAAAGLDPVFEDFARERHVPGLVYGVVHGGRLVYVRSFGVQDVDSRRPVTPATVFRIASMTKNFTALGVLKLRDEGRLALDAPVETYVHRARPWRGATGDSPKLTVRHLLGHMGGFVTDDPWGDRQLDLDPAAFSAFLESRPPYARAGGEAFEYSNFGYALLGRIVENTSGRDYDAFMETELLRPLGMTSSTFHLDRIAPDRRAHGYRWEDERWKPEPVLRHGAYGAMGGLHTTAEDYARYLAFVLSAWPPRDGPESPVLKRSSVREIAIASSSPRLFRRPLDQRADAEGCDVAGAYGLGMIVMSDCRLGVWLTHGGGLPGYGSNVVLIPQRDLAVFAFSNLTYAPLATPVREAAARLVASGAFPTRPVPASESLRAMQAAAGRIYAAGDVAAAPEALAVNVLLDLDAAHRNAELAQLRRELGACQTAERLEPATAMQGLAVWRCERGRLQARLLLAPTTPPTLQVLEFSKAD